MKNNKPGGFTVYLQIDYVHDPEADEYILKNPKEMMAGSFWQASITKVKDSESRILNTQSALQIDHTVRGGGLQALLKNLTGLIPRFLDENGLKNR